MMYWQSSLKRCPTYFPTVVGTASLFFILLVCFMISNSIVSWPGVTVRLPMMNAVEISAADKLIVTVASNGDIFFNGSKLDGIASLETKLSTKVHAGMQAQQKVDAGKEAPVEVKNVALCPHCGGVLPNVRHREMPSQPEGIRRPTIVLCADKAVGLDICTQIMDMARSLGMEVVLTAEQPGKNAAIPRFQDK